MPWRASGCHYKALFIAKPCVSGILPRFFADGKPLSQDILSKRWAQLYIRPPFPVVGPERILLVM